MRSFAHLLHTRRAGATAPGFPRALLLFEGSLPHHPGMACRGNVVVCPNAFPGWRARPEREPRDSGFALRAPRNDDNRCLTNKSETPDELRRAADGVAGLDDATSSPPRPLPPSSSHPPSRHVARHRLPLLAGVVEIVRRAGIERQSSVVPAAIERSATCWQIGGRDLLVVGAEEHRDRRRGRMRCSSSASRPQPG